MRGKGRLMLTFKQLYGITPAHAGKSLTTFDAGKLIPGSPPHMRGKVKLHGDTKRYSGITPAHAGKRAGHRLGLILNKDHPRTCGEKQRGGLDAAQKLGSPPHMRGKGFVTAGKSPPLGITPAHAGKRESLSRCSSCTWDHPRTCGEKYVSYAADFWLMGSPPHMRGKVLYGLCRWFALGITPAHAGKSQLDNSE